MIEVENVSFSYVKRSIESNVLEDVNVKFDLGKFYSIFGPSGSGKTTLLSILGGIETPNTGKVLIDNIPIKQIGEVTVRRKYVSYIFQNYLLFPYMTAIENVVTALDISNAELKNKSDEAVSIMESLGIEKKDMKRSVRKLSGGQQQRVAIARALSAGTSYILADEPTGNLDSKNALGIIEIFKELVQKQNKCLIVVTHSDMVRSNSDISYELVDGTLRQGYRT